MVSMYSWVGLAYTRSNHSVRGTGLQRHRLTKAQAYRGTGLQRHRPTEVQEYRGTGLQRHTGMQQIRCSCMCTHVWVQIRWAALVGVAVTRMLWTITKDSGSLYRSLYGLCYYHCIYSTTWCYTCCGTRIQIRLFSQQILIVYDMLKVKSMRMAKPSICRRPLWRCELFASAAFLGHQTSECQYSNDNIITV